MADSNAKAWNNFVFFSQPDNYEAGDSMRSAAIAKQYMGLANNGGIDSFLTSSYDLGASEVLAALASVGASIATKELGHVLRTLGTPLPASSEEARWGLLEKYWSKSLDEYDLLSHEADSELMRVLEIHVREHEAFYLALAE